MAAGHAGRIMLNVLRGLAGATRSFLRTQRALALEHLALRHQIGVLKRGRGKRRLQRGLADRGLWATLSRVLRGWEQALAFVQPATVIGWHGQGSSACGHARAGLASLAGLPSTERSATSSARSRSPTQPGAARGCGTNWPRSASS